MLNLAVLVRCFISVFFLHNFRISRAGLDRLRLDLAASRAGKLDIAAPVVSKTGATKAEKIKATKATESLGDHRRIECYVLG